jgi:tetratricopeptide (TPR) repeat protein
VPVAPVQRPVEAELVLLGDAVSLTGSVLPTDAVTRLLGRLYIEPPGAYSAPSYASDTGLRQAPALEALDYFTFCRDAQRRRRQQLGESFAKAGIVLADGDVLHESGRIAADHGLGPNTRMTSLRARVNDRLRLHGIGDVRAVKSGLAAPGLSADLDLVIWAAARGDLARAVWLARGGRELGEILMPLAWIADTGRLPWLDRTRQTYASIVDGCLASLAEEQAGRRRWTELESAIDLTDQRLGLVRHLVAPGAGRDARVAERTRELVALRDRYWMALREHELEAAGTRLRVAGTLLVDCDDAVLGTNRAYRSADRHGATRYINRGAEERAVRAALSAADGRPALVVVYGSPRSGKTRLLANVARELVGTSPTLMPARREDVPFALDEAARMAAVIRLGPAEGRSVPVVVWLEDLERYAGPGGLRDADVHALGAATGVLVLATAGGKGTSHLTAAEIEEMRGPLEGLLAVAERVDVRAEFAAADLERAVEERLYTAAEVAEMRRHDPGVYFSAGDLHVRRLLDLERDVPSAGAVLRAACAWRNLGVADPIPADALRDVWAATLRGAEPTAELFAASLETASSPTIANARPLWWVSAADGGSLHDVDSYLAAYQAGQGAVADEQFSAVLEHASPLQAFTIGFSAPASDGDRARRAYERAIASRHPHIAASASINLGLQLFLAGDAAASRQALEFALVSGTPDATSRASLGVGLALSAEDDLRGAIDAFRRTIESGDHHLALTASVALAYLLMAKGERAEALAAFQEALALGEQGPPAETSVSAERAAELAELEDLGIRPNEAGVTRALDSVPQAAFWLGVLMSEAGDVEGASAAYRKAIASGHAEHAPKASINLAHLLFDRGEFQEGRTILERVLEDGPDDYIPRAAFNLGAELQAVGDMPGAVRAYRSAVATGDAELGPQAATNLGGLLFEMGEAEEAEAVLRQVLEERHEQLSPIAALNLAARSSDSTSAVLPEVTRRLLVDSGHEERLPAWMLTVGRVFAGAEDAEGAAAAYRIVLGLGNAQTVPAAALELGATLVGTGDPEGAAAAFRIAVEGADADIAADAAFRLGRLLADAGDLEGAAAAHRTAVARGNDEVTPYAAFHLGFLLSELDRYDEAAKAYAIVVGSDSEHAITAAVNLGHILLELDDPQGAKAAFDRARTSDADAVATAAALGLGRVLQRQGDPADAAAEYRFAMESHDPGVAAAATTNLGTLLSELGDREGAAAAYERALSFDQELITRFASEKLRELREPTS